MNCDQVERILIDNLLVGRSQVRDHLEQCINCRTLFEELESIEELSQNLGEGQGAPRDFSNQVFRQTVEVRPAGRDSWKPATAVLLGVALAVVLSWQLSPLLIDRLAQAQSAAPLDLNPSLGTIQPVSINPATHDRDNGDHVDMIFETVHPQREPQIFRLPSTIHLGSQDRLNGDYQQYASY